MKPLLADIMSRVEGTISLLKGTHEMNPLLKRFEMPTDFVFKSKTRMVSDASNRGSTPKK